MCKLRYTNEITTMHTSVSGDVPFCVSPYERIESQVCFTADVSFLKCVEKIKGENVTGLRGFLDFLQSATVGVEVDGVNAFTINSFFNASGSFGVVNSTSSFITGDFVVNVDGSVCLKLLYRIPKSWENKTIRLTFALDLYYPTSGELDTLCVVQQLKVKPCEVPLMASNDVFNNITVTDGQGNPVQTICKGENAVLTVTGSLLPTIPNPQDFTLIPVLVCDATGEVLENYSTSGNLTNLVEVPDVITSSDLDFTGGTGVVTIDVNGLEPDKFYSLCFIAKDKNCVIAASGLFCQFPNVLNFESSNNTVKIVFDKTGNYCYRYKRVPDGAWSDVVDLIEVTEIEILNLYGCTCYQIEVTYKCANGKSSKCSLFIETLDCPFTLGAGVRQEVTCEGLGVITVDTFTGADLVLKDELGTVIQTVNQPITLPYTFIGLEEGNYIICGTKGSCTKAVYLTVQDNKDGCCADILIDIGDVTCLNSTGYIDVTVTPLPTSVTLGLTYSIEVTNGVNTFTTSGLTFNVPNLAAGTYTVTVTASDGSECVEVVEILKDLTCDIPSNLQTYIYNGCATITWDAVPNASEYCISIYSNNNLLVEPPTTTTDLNYVFKNACGVYYFTIQSKCGTSCESDVSKYVYFVLTGCECPDSPELSYTCDPRIEINSTVTPNMIAGTKIEVSIDGCSTFSDYKTFDGTSWSAPLQNVPFSCVVPEFTGSTNAEGELCFDLVNFGDFDDVKVSNDGINFASSNQCCLQTVGSENPLIFVTDDGNGGINVQLSNVVNFSGGVDLNSLVVGQDIVNYPCPTFSDVSDLVTTTYAQQSPLILGSSFANVTLGQMIYNAAGVNEDIPMGKIKECFEQGNSVLFFQDPNGVNYVLYTESITSILDLPNNEFLVTYDVNYNPAYCCYWFNQYVNFNNYLPTVLNPQLLIKQINCYKINDYCDGVYYGVACNLGETVIVNVVIEDLLNYDILYGGVVVQSYVNGVPNNPLPALECKNPCYFRLTKCGTTKTYKIVAQDETTYKIYEIDGLTETLVYDTADPLTNNMCLCCPVCVKVSYVFDPSSGCTNFELTELINYNDCNNPCDYFIT